MTIPVSVLFVYFTNEVVISRLWCRRVICRNMSQLSSQKIEKDLEFGAIRNSIFTKLYSDDNPYFPDSVKLRCLYISPMK